MKYSIRHLMLLIFTIAVALWAVRTFEVRKDTEGFDSFVIHGTHTSYAYCKHDGEWQWISFPEENLDHVYSEDELREPGKKIAKEHPEWLQAR